MNSSSETGDKRDVGIEERAPGIPKTYGSVTIKPRERSTALNQHIEVRTAWSMYKIQHLNEDKRRQGIALGPKAMLCVNEFILKYPNVSSHISLCFLSSMLRERSIKVK